MKIEKKIIDAGGAKYLVSGLPDAAVGDTFHVLTAEEYKNFKEEVGTNRQNRFFHAMMNDVYKSHGWSISGLSEKEQDMMTLDQFREWVKVEFGQGYSKFAWIDLAGGRHLTSKKPEPGEAQLVIGYVKSWSNYTRAERRDCISAFVSWAEAQGLSAVIEKHRRELE